MLPGRKSGMTSLAKSRLEDDLMLTCWDIRNVFAVLYVGLMYVHMSGTKLLYLCRWTRTFTSHHVTIIVMPVDCGVVLKLLQGLSWSNLQSWHLMIGIPGLEIH